MVDAHGDFNTPDSTTRSASPRPHRIAKGPEPAGLSLATAVGAVGILATAIPVVGFGATGITLANGDVGATIDAIAHLAEAALGSNA